MLVASFQNKNLVNVSAISNQKLVNTTIPDHLASILRWYFSKVFGLYEGPGLTPFYCDPGRVGHCAVDPKGLSRGHATEIFRLFVTLAMYQARRDIVIMKQQRSFTREEANLLLCSASLGRRVAASTCPSLSDPGTFVRSCTVRKIGGAVSCDHDKCPCPVRDASLLLRRMGDQGKLPISAYFELGQPGGLDRILCEVKASTPDPTLRADVLVTRLSHVHRVGRKLATLFVSALSTPALAPGLTPWFPEINGNSLVVVDTHAAKAIDHLRKGKGARTYSARVTWLRSKAKMIDLRSFRPDLPSYSPRLIQQAFYAFGSKSNRMAWGLTCHEDCKIPLCPFHR